MHSGGYLPNQWIAFQNEAQCEAFHMEISFIHMQILVHLHDLWIKLNFHIKGFALGLALKQRRKATRKSPNIGRIIISESQWKSMEVNGIDAFT